ncbi:MAG: DNA polymerase I [Clostridia bacterium]|nr:DNA polymerase I [Clostridia bacterium]
MKLMVLDGNSILNRAFYGTKPMSTKDGRSTHGILGFLNILQSKTKEIAPDAVAIAFDLKAPTFRHKMYDGYKAQRKGMPPELAQQVQPLKAVLRALGYTLIECEGWEADDLLGTLAANAKDSDECCIVTGDRDSLQLVDGKVRVYLTKTQMGSPVTTVYDEEKVQLEYGVTPPQLIDIKALMGDSSDNIPGVAGIGQKGAGDLIRRFHDIDYIYEHIDEIDVKDGVRSKLKADRDMAFLSRTLGTIRTDAPIETDYHAYVKQEADNFEAVKLLADLEMFRTIERLHLDPKAVPVAEKEETKQEAYACVECDNVSALQAAVEAQGKCYFALEEAAGEISGIYVRSGKEVVHLSALNLMFGGFIADLFENEAIEKFTDNAKLAYAYALQCGLDLNNLVFDSMLSGYLLNPSVNDYTAGRLAMEYGVAVPQEDEIPAPALTAWLLPKLSETLTKKLAENEELDLLREMEIPLAQVLAAMEQTGFAVDRNGIALFGKQLEAEIETITKEICEEVGYEFNLNSPKQLGEALFEKLRLPNGKRTKSGWSTTAELLEKLADDYPVVEKILLYRQYTKLNSTYCVGLIKAIGADGRIHSTLNQTETRTGRISSAEPNLQNIPVRSDLGREMRKFFVARPGCLLVDADYSQIELRVLADAADDQTMIDAFNNGDDIHAITASQVFNMPLEMVTPLMRSRAKAVNFGIVYGIGAFSLAKNIGVTRAEADRYIKGYLAHYHGVDAYMKNSVERAKANGYAETLFHRRRYLPELTAGNAMLRAFGERVAMNMPIQGTAADIIKIAMIKVFRRLKAENLRARLILQVHDELIIEAPETEADRVGVLLKEEMENAVSLKVKMLADVHAGKTWYDAKG